VDPLGVFCALATVPVKAKATAVANIAPATLVFFIAEISLQVLKSRDNCSRRFLAFNRENGQGASNLKITFAWFGALPLPGFDLHRFDLIVDLAEPMLKLRGLDLHADLAALADDVRFTVLFDFAHEKRVLETALRARNVYGFVFKHFQTSQRSYKILRWLRIDRIAQLQGTSIRGGRQTELLN
jgi:hypothetical protein